MVAERSVNQRRFMVT